MSYQQINLYQAEFRKQRQLFTARNLALAIVLLGAGLLAYYGIALREVAGLSERLALQERQRDEALARLEQLRAALPARAKSVELEQEVERLRAELQARQQVASLLGDKVSGNVEGFVEHLSGLARQKPSSLWLTKVVIGKGGTDLLLTGSALQPEQVPRYLQRLSQEKVFMGAEFRRFEIARPEKEPNRVDFLVRTTPEPEEEK